MEMFSSFRTSSFFVFAFFLPLVFSIGENISYNIGINYGRLGSNLPSRYESIELIKSMNVRQIKLYDADAEILRLLSGTKIRVSIMVQNQDIIDIANNQITSDQWVQRNVLAYYPQTMIRYVLVGNEVLSYSTYQDRQVWSHLVPAMRNIKNSIKSAGIRNIKIGTPLAMDALQTTYPPSSGTFRPDVSNTVIVPLLKFLNGTRSFFFVDVYPYFPWTDNPTRSMLDFALFRGNTSYTDLGTGLVYTNLLDQMLDSVVFAMSKLGFPDIQIAISETGWPTAGEIDQIGANVYNAATYNRNLVTKMASNGSLGTPARPGWTIPTFIFSLFDENMKTGAETERHWGLLYPNGTHIYTIDLTGNRSPAEYDPFPARPRYRGRVWCVAARGASSVDLGRVLDNICGEGNQTCAPLSPGRECYEPVSIVSHASYAFSSYWSQFRSTGATCSFNGLAVQTTTDPGHRHCMFPSVTI